MTPFKVSLSASTIAALVDAVTRAIKPSISTLSQEIQMALTQLVELTDLVTKLATDVATRDAAQAAKETDEAAKIVALTAQVDALTAQIQAGGTVLSAADLAAFDALKTKINEIDATQVAPVI